MKQDRLDYAVEHYPNRPVVEADENRLIAETKSREIRKNTDMDMADKVTLHKNPGFTTDKLMTDIRYKV